MKRGLWIAVGAVFIWAVVAAVVLLGREPSERSPMKLTSASFKAGQAIPETFTCRGAGINPPLSVSDVPSGARTLALIVSDPDAPGGTFYHWLVWNMPADVTMIPENWQPPAGTGVGKNGFGKTAYGAPCPPSGTHHYHFMLYAVDTSLKLPSGATQSELTDALGDRVLEQAELIGTVSASH